METRWQANLLHRLIQHPATAAIYRFIHPDFGIRLVEWLSPVLGHNQQNQAVLIQAAQRQLAWAEHFLEQDPSTGLLVMGHTHRPALSEPVPGRQYLNPGAWYTGFCYAVATESTAELRSFSPGALPLLSPAAPR
jgi:UDP-2,3-diacylglucosamine pyrophosphatase LpxH